MIYLIIFIILIIVIIGLILYVRRRKAAIKLHKASEFILYIVKVPREIKLKEGEQLKTFADLLAVGEHLYSSFHGIYKKGAFVRLLGSQPHISLEVTSSKGEIAFYVGTTRDLAPLIEKQLHSHFQAAQIERTYEHHLFRPQEGYVATKTFKQGGGFVLPIRTYRMMETDPLNSITNSLSKLGRGESAAVQVLLRPIDNSWRGASIKAINLIQEGKGSAATSFGFAGGASKIGSFFSGLFGMFRSSQKSDQAPTPTTHNLTPVEEKQIANIQEKANKVAFETQIRILATSPEKEQAEAIAESVASSFSQFSSPEGNNLNKAKVKNKDAFIKNYIYRIFSERDPKMLLNTEEIASVYHFPNQYVETPSLVLLSAKDAPAPPNLPEEGTTLGEAVFRGVIRKIKIKNDDRLRHIYIIGKTGVGKTTMMETMILDDIRDGKGVGLIDPHGDLVESLLTKIPKSRAEDVILFDPGEMERPLGLNLLEWKTKEERDFLVQEAVSIFYKLFDPTRQGFIGPQFEHWMRNAALTLMDQPDGGTLIEIPRLFTDKSFELKCVQNIKDETVKHFWTKQMAQTSQQHKSEMLNYFTSKFGRFMTNEMVRNIMGQAKSSFDLREVMDKKKIFLANLSKGKMGEVNSNLIGMILVAKLQMAAMSRVDIPEDERVDFFLYVDEFQNFATDSFATILSEARKYHLSLTIANQYVAQLEENIRDAVFGNAGTLTSFRIGAADAEYVTKEFEPVFTQEDLINVDKYHAYIRLLIDKVPTAPFSMRTTLDKTEARKETAQAIKRLSSLKFGRPKAEIERMTKKRAETEGESPEGGSFGPGTSPTKSP